LFPIFQFLKGLFQGPSKEELKEFKEKVRQRVASTAEEVTKQVKSAGLSDSAAEQIRRQILGITGE
jgi:hypothetical protein